MVPEKHLDNEYITMWYHKDKGIVHHEWHKFLSGDKMREAFMTGTELLRKNKGTKWLSDDRKYPLLSAEDGKWAETTWFPETVKAGWKHWAIVLPEKPVGQINIKAFIKKYAEAGINAMIFTNPDEAMKWLESQ